MPLANLYLPVLVRDGQMCPRLNPHFAVYAPHRNQSDGWGQHENSTQPRRHRTPSMNSNSFDIPLLVAPGLITAKGMPTLRLRLPAQPQKNVSDLSDAPGRREAFFRHRYAGRLSR